MFFNSSNIPLLWFWLFILFIMIFMLFNILNYFLYMTKNKKLSMEKTYSMKNLNWK